MDYCVKLIDEVTWKLLLFQTEMISALFLWENVLLGRRATNRCKKFKFWIFLDCSLYEIWEYACKLKPFQISSNTSIKQARHRDAIILTIYLIGWINCIIFFLTNQPIILIWLIDSFHVTLYQVIMLAPAMLVSFCTTIYWKTKQNVLLLFISYHNTKLWLCDKNINIISVEIWILL